MALLKKLFGKAGKGEEKTTAAKTTLRKQAPGQEQSSLEIVGKQEWKVKSLPEWKPGDIIQDTYEVEEVITGGMANVYITHHKKWERKMVIKSPNEMMLSDKDNFARVLREANSWIGLGLHPNIAFCYYVKKIDEVPHIVVEYVDGGNLRQWIEDGKCIDYRVNLDLAIQFCHGMEYAHSKGIIHRDIKPENILMTKDSVLKITDFGLVKGGASIQEKVGADQKVQQQTNPTLTRLGDFMGTEGYLSPEQAESAAEVDKRTDIFSFGVCLYEMFCGNKPYLTIYGPKQEPPDPLILSRDETFPQRLAELLKKLVQWNRDDRPREFEIIREKLSQIYLELYNEESPYVELEFVEMEADGLNNQGVSFYEMEQIDEAEACFKKILKIDGTHPQATYNLGLLEYRSGKIIYKEAVERLERCRQNPTVNPEIVDHLIARTYVEGLNLNAAWETLKNYSGLFAESFGKLKPHGARCIAVIKKHKDSVNSIYFSLDCKQALSEGKAIYDIEANHNNPLKLWDLEKKECIAELKGHKGNVNSICFSLDGRLVLSGGMDDTLRLWTLEKKWFRRYCKAVLKGHNDSVNSVCFSPDGRLVLSGSSDKTLRLWALEKKWFRRYCIAVLKGHNDSVNSVCFSPDGRQVLSGSSDTNLCLWDLESRECIAVLKGHCGPVTSVCFSPDGRLALSGSQDKTLRLWNLEKRKCIAVLEGLKREVTTISFSPDGKMALIGCGEKNDGGIDYPVLLWDMLKKECFGALKGSGVTSVSFSPDGTQVLLGGYRIQLWDISQILINMYSYRQLPELCFPRNFKEIKKEWDKLENMFSNFMKENKYVEAFRFLISSWKTKNYRRDKSFVNKYRLLYKRAKPGVVVTIFEYMNFERDKDRVNSDSFSPDGRFSLSWSKDNTLRLRDLKKKECISLLEGGVHRVKSACFSPDGRLALAGYKKESEIWVFSPLRIWDLEKKECLAILEGHKHSVTSVCFSPNGRLAISGSDDNTIRIWDVEKKECLTVLQGHKDCVISICFSPDGRLALSGSNDHTLRLWDLESRQCIAVLEGQNGITSACFGPDGSTIISGSCDETLRIWRVIRDLEFPEPMDWDEAVRPYLKIFLTLCKGKWNDNDFKEFIKELAEKRGLGWVKPEGIRKELEKMTDEYKQKRLKSGSRQLFHKSQKDSQIKRKHKKTNIVKKVKSVNPMKHYSKIKKAGMLRRKTFNKGNM